MKFSAMTDADIVAELCQRIKAYRISQRLSQSQLAESAQIGTATLKRIERGQPATLSTIVAVFRALGCIEQLEPLLFSNQNTDGATAVAAHPGKMPARIRSKAEPKIPRDVSNSLSGQGDGYAVTARNNVIWPQPSDLKEGGRR